MYLAHHELQNVIIFILTGASNLVLAHSGELSSDRDFSLYLG